ncbi:MAG: hypothetical protein WCS15_10745, partial [Prevotella sp.]
MPKQAVPLIKVGGYHRNAWVVFTEIRTIFVYNDKVKKNAIYGVTNAGGAKGERDASRGELVSERS